MSQPEDARVTVPEDSLPLRDWWLLPLVVLSVTLAVLGIVEISARRMFADRGQFTCEMKDSSGLVRHKPNCICYLKIAEGPLVEYRFNECGYRSAKPCGTKPRDTLRVVLMGTSTAMGLHVPAEETFAARTEKALNRMCSQPVEIQNLGRVVGPYALPEMADEALGLSPDVIVLTLSPFDISGRVDVSPPSAQRDSTGIARIKLAWEKLKFEVHDSKSGMAAAHFGLMNEQMIYQAFLRNGTQRDVMTFPLTDSGERMYAEFAAIFDRTMARFEGSGVPILVTAIPNRVAAAMVSNHSPMEVTYARGFGRYISEAAVRQGALALDLTPEFARVPHAERLFYPVDTHPTGRGHAAIARALVDRLTDGSLSQLAACRTSGSGAR